MPRKADSAAYTRLWTHRDLVAGRCSAKEYLDDLKADVDRRLGIDRELRQAGYVHHFTTRALLRELTRRLLHV